MSRGLRAIAVTAVGVGLVLAGLVVMARAGGGGAATTVEAVFVNVTGLNHNASVTFAGVRVGEVTDIDPWDDGQKAKIVVALSNDAGLDLRRDLSLTIRLKSILGELFVDFDPGSDAAPYDGSLVESTHRDTSLDRVIFAGAEIAGDLRAAEETKVVVDRLRSLVEGSGDDITAISGNARLLVEGLATRAETMRAIISDLDAVTAATEGRAAEVGQAVADVRSTLEQVRRLLERNHDTIVSLADTVRHVVDTADVQALDELLAEAPEALDQIYEMTRLAHAWVHRDVPVTGSIPLVGPYSAESAYEQTRITARNPIVRKLLISVLRSYLRGSESTTVVPG